MSASLWLARCLLSEAFWRPCQQNFIRGYVRHKSLFQTVKCSSFDQRKVPIMRCSRSVIFYFKSSVFRHVLESHLWDGIRPCRKNYISGSVWHKSFIQMVKYSFPDERICYQTFLRRVVEGNGMGSTKMAANKRLRKCDVTTSLTPQFTPRWGKILHFVCRRTRAEWKCVVLTTL